MWRAREIGDEFVDNLRRLGIDLIVVRGEEIFDRERAWLRRELGRGRLWLGASLRSGAVEGLGVFGAAGRLAEARRFESRMPKVMSL